MLREAHPKGLADDTLTVEFPREASFHRQLAEEPKNATLLAEALYEVTGRHLALAFEVGENGGETDEPAPDEPASEEEIIELMKGTFDAREVERRMSMDFNKMMEQVQQMQAQMQQAQEELKNETVQATAGGGMVTVKATGGGEIKEIKIDPKAIDPDDPEMLEDMVLAAVNEALRSAQSLIEAKLGPAMGGLQRPRPAGALDGRRGSKRCAACRSSPSSATTTCSASPTP